MSSGTVSTELRLRIVTPQRPARLVTARLVYSRDDPYAVRIAFPAGRGKLVEWVFARDLLSMGMEGRAGLGDVTVWPPAGSGNGTPGSVLNVELSSPSGRVHFTAPAKKVSAFLRRTYRVVPPGGESEHVDIDAGLAGVLRRAALARDRAERPCPRFIPRPAPGPAAA
ncbi:MAG TPA: SsgA family sporulation/cell division regulator [Trebonia sp.]|jgi:hypothetical protein|nr:SsgA family sporulation/cell division regulator [Trebonia sp.]